MTQHQEPRDQMNPLPGDLFSRRLRHERERAGISQAELARRIAEILESNIDPSAVTRIEQQVRAVRLDEAVAAAKALSIPLVALLADDAEVANEEAIQAHLTELAVQHRQWEKTRQEINRITRIIQNLSGQHAQLGDIADIEHGTRAETPAAAEPYGRGEDNA